MRWGYHIRATEGTDATPEELAGLSGSAHAHTHTPTSHTHHIWPTEHIHAAGGRGGDRANQERIPGEQTPVPVYAAASNSLNT